MLISPIHLPPTMGKPGFTQSQSITVRISAIDHENYRASWVTAGGLPKWALFAERWQMLTEQGAPQALHAQAALLIASTVEGGKTVTKYESIEVFSGIIAYLVKLFTGKNLVLGVKAMAEGLKSRSESA